MQTLGNNNKHVGEVKGISSYHLNFDTPYFQIMGFNFLDRLKGDYRVHANLLMVMKCVSITFGAGCP